MTDHLSRSETSRWYRVERRTTTGETIFVEADSAAEAKRLVRDGEYDDGPFSPRHIRESIVSARRAVGYESIRGDR